MQLDRSTREVELGLEYGTPTMNLTGQSLKFENGQWVAGSAVRGGWACRGHGWLMALRVVSLFPPEIGSFTGDRREMQRLRKRNQQLEEENNLLRLKVDILLDMVSNEPLSALRGGSADVKGAGGHQRKRFLQWRVHSIPALPHCARKNVVPKQRWGKGLTSSAPSAR